MIRRPDVRKACVSFSSFSFRTGTPRMVHAMARNRSRIVHGTFFLFLFALRSESPLAARAPSCPHPGSRNCFLSSYPVVLRAPFQYRTRRWSSSSGIHRSVIYLLSVTRIPRCISKAACRLTTSTHSKHKIFFFFFKVYYLKRQKKSRKLSKRRFKLSIFRNLFLNNFFRNLWVTNAIYITKNLAF